MYRNSSTSATMNEGRSQQQFRWWCDDVFFVVAVVPLFMIKRMVLITVILIQIVSAVATTPFSKTTTTTVITFTTTTRRRMKRYVPSLFYDSDLPLYTTTTTTKAERFRFHHPQQQQQQQQHNHQRFFPLCEKNRFDSRSLLLLRGGADISNGINDSAETTVTNHTSTILTPPTTDTSTTTTTTTIFSSQYERDNVIDDSDNAVLLQIENQQDEQSPENTEYEKIVVTTEDNNDKDAIHDAEPTGSSFSENIVDDRSGEKDDDTHPVQRNTTITEQQQQQQEYKVQGKQLYRQQMYMEAAQQFHYAIQQLILSFVDTMLQTTQEQDDVGPVDNNNNNDNNTTTTSLNMLLQDIIERYPNISNVNLDTSTSGNSSSSTFIRPGIKIDDDKLTQFIEEYATLLLHETLCYIQYCTSARQGQQQQQQGNEEDMKQLQSMDDVINQTTHLIQVFHNCNRNDNETEEYSKLSSSFTQLRARAHYRRSKAIYMKMQILQLQAEIERSCSNNSTYVMETIAVNSSLSTETSTKFDSNGDVVKDVNGMAISNDLLDEMYEQVIHDVRTAAYIGDSKAVAWYGQLIRQRSNNKNRHEDNANPTTFSHRESLKSSNGNIMETTPSLSSPSFPSSSSAQLLQSLLMSTSNTGSLSPGDDAASPVSGEGNFLSQMLMSSLMTTSHPTGSAPSTSSNSKTNPMQSMIRGFLSRFANDATLQQRLCTMLQNLSKQQVQSYIQLFGLSNIVPETVIRQYIDPVISFCHSITIIRLRRMIFVTKWIHYGIQIVQRVIRILNKYRSMVVLYLLQIWIKSSILRPTPLSKRQKRLLKIQQQTQQPAPKVITLL